MASRYSAARPKRDGETFARTHHHGQDEGDAAHASKEIKFDPRNPSALAPDAREEDAVLEADVIGGSAGVKRGAVNIDGYDSDSDNDTFDARARERAKKQKGREVNFIEQLNAYDDPDGAEVTNKRNGDDDDDDMFAAGDDDDGRGDKEQIKNANDDDPTAFDVKKQVRFLEADEIRGQEDDSRDRSRISISSRHHLDRDESSDDEEDVELAIQEEAVDEEVGAGGLRRNAPKIEAFNIKQENEEGRFDKDGNYVRKAADPDAVHDKWLDGVTKRDMRRAAEAHEKREAEARRRRVRDDELLVQDLLGALILRLERGETALEALARLGRKQPRQKRVPRWKLKKAKKGDPAAAAATENGDEAMDVDPAKPEEDPQHRKNREDIEAITEAADSLLSRDHPEIYDTERGLLLREYKRESGEDWAPPARPAGQKPKEEKLPRTAATAATAATVATWEYRWTDGRDGGGATQGPFDGPTMKAWQDAGYFGEGVEFREAGEEEGWTRLAKFV